MVNSLTPAQIAKRNCTECILQPLCVPASVGLSDVEELGNVILDRRGMSRGDVLYRPGEVQKSVFAAQTGAFKTVALNEAGDEQVIGFFLPGEIMGMDGLGSGKFRCEAIALEAAKVCEIPLTALERVAAQRPQLQHHLMKAIGQGVARHQDHMEMVGRKQADHRIAMFLHSVSERQANLSRSATQLTLPMSRMDIASYLGLVIETVSRGLSRLQEQQLITVKGRQVTLLDPAKLSNIAHGYDE